MRNDTLYQAQADFVTAATISTSTRSAATKTPITCEVKSRKSGAGFVQLEQWLGEFDLLALRRNNAEPIIVVPWRTWAALLGKVRR